MKNILYIVFLVVIGVQAQQDPQYTQYMYNMNVINPAYAGSSESVSIGAMYRSQWVGLEGSPSTGTCHTLTRRKPSRTRFIFNKR